MRFYVNEGPALGICIAGDFQGDSFNPEPTQLWDPKYLSVTTLGNWNCSPENKPSFCWLFSSPRIMLHDCRLGGANWNKLKIDRNDPLWDHGGWKEKRISGKEGAASSWIEWSFRELEEKILQSCVTPREVYGSSKGASEWPSFSLLPLRKTNLPSHFVETSELWM